MRGGAEGPITPGYVNLGGNASHQPPLTRNTGIALTPVDLWRTAVVADIAIKQIGDGTGNVYGVVDCAKVHDNVFLAQGTVVRNRVCLLEEPLAGHAQTQPP